MSIAIEKLHNKGIAFFGDKRKLEEKQKTLVVLGVARSGTCRTTEKESIRSIPDKKGK